MAPVTVGSAGNSLLRVKSNEQIEEEARASKAPLPSPELLVGLAAIVRNSFSANKTAKQEIETRLLNCDRRMRGQYDPAKLAAIEAVGATIFINLTARKVRDTQAWINDYMHGATEKIWALQPTPAPDLPQDALDYLKQEALKAAFVEIVASGGMPDPQSLAATAGPFYEELRESTVTATEEMALKRAKAMEKKMDDQLRESDFTAEMDAFVAEAIRRPAGFIMGPIMRRVYQADWKQDPATGAWTLKLTKKIVPTFDSIDAANVFPQGDARSIQDGNLIILRELRMTDIQEFIGVPGYSDSAIEEIMSKHHAGHKEDLPIRSDLDAIIRQDSGTTSESYIRLDALQFFGAVRGKHLREWGMSEQEVPEESRYYDIECWSIGDIVFRAILNPLPGGKKPISSTAWRPENGTVWGYSVPEELQDSQDMANAAARALANNMAMASGPMCEVDTDRLVPGEDMDIHPWKVIRTQTDPMVGDNKPAIQFYNTPFVSEKLQSILSDFEKKTDTIVPSYAAGGAAGSGAGETASGLSMLQSNFSKTLKFFLVNVLRAMGERLSDLYYINMLTETDDALKGDARIMITDIISMMSKEVGVMRLKEAMQITMNPIDQAIMGNEGRAEMLRGLIKDLPVDTRKVIPSEQKLKQIAMQQQAQMQAEMAEEQQEGQSGQPMSPETIAQNNGAVKSRKLDSAGNPAQGTDTRMSQMQGGMRNASA